jgi:RNA polymerase sigma factor (sigma-70 family)
MDERDWLAARFEEHRTHLRAVAYRMLGSRSEADDAVQDAWLRVYRADTSDVANLGGWLTTIVARVCLNMLQSRQRRAEPVGGQLPEQVAATEEADDPEQAALLADSVGLALLVVLDALAPAERLAFVLHDMFDVPFEEIAPIVDRSPAATRQLASRARRRIRGVAPSPDPDPNRRREVVAAFVAASQGGDFDALLALLDPDVVVRADRAAVQLGVLPEMRGAAAVAGHFSRRARALRQALVDGATGAVWAPGGRVRVVVIFTLADGGVTAVDLVADPDRLGDLDVAIIGA